VGGLLEPSGTTTFLGLRGVWHSGKCDVLSQDMDNFARAGTTPRRISPHRERRADSLSKTECKDGGPASAEKRKKQIPRLQENAGSG